jgi:hypothetical protein
MTTEKSKYEETKPWEILGVIFAVFVTVKDAPDILRQLGVTAFIPTQWKQLLLTKYDDSAFWLSWFYILLIIFLYAVILLYFKQKNELDTPDKEKTDKEIVSRLSRQFRFYRYLRIIRSLGVVLIRELILDFMSVATYGTFKKTSNWPATPEPRIKYVDRISLKEGPGFEYQYGKEFKWIYVREHPEFDDKYGYTLKRVPEWRDIKLLLVASNIFPFWLIFHLVKRPFLKKKTTKR